MLSNVLSRLKTRVSRKKESIWTYRNLLLISESIRPVYSETTPVKRQKTSSAESPRHFFLHMLLKRPEGLWDKAESAENSTQWERCTEYFDFLYQLLYFLHGIGHIHTVYTSCMFLSSKVFMIDLLTHNSRI